MLKVFGMHANEDATADYRIWRPFQAMKEMEICDTKHPPKSNRGAGAMTLDRQSPGYNYEIGCYEDWAIWADIIVAQRIVSMSGLATVMGMREAFGRPVVADMDDNFLWIPPSNQSYTRYAKRKTTKDIAIMPIRAEDVIAYRQRQDGMVVQDRLGAWGFAQLKAEPSGREVAIDFLKEADAITTTTEYLAEELRQLNPYVYVLPNCIEVERWQKIVPPAHEMLRIGWFGGMQHYDDLKILERVVPRILADFPDVEFVTTMSVPDFWAHELSGNPRFRIVPFAPAQEWAEYLGGQGIDIALAPLVDDRFNRGKSNLKYLEHSALGIAGVYQDVESYKDVRHGNTGLKATTETEWYDCIAELIKDSGKRKKLGMFAQNDVFGRFDIRRNAHLWEKCYSEVMKRSSKMRQNETNKIRSKMIQDRIKGNLLDAQMRGENPLT